VALGGAAPAAAATTGLARPLSSREVTMDRRTFLNASSVLLGSAALTRLVACTPTSRPQPQRSLPTPLQTPLTNWAGNVRYSTGNVHYPHSVEQVQDIVRQTPKLRALGTRHSFNRIADSTRAQLSLRELNRVVSLDRSANTVTVEAGMTYGALCQYLQEQGYALHNLASLPHISIAGSCATATHGSGVTNGNLATAVAAIEFVTAAGDVVVLSRQKDGEQFRGAVVGLGGLGVVTKLALDLQPTFEVSQVVYRNLPMGELERNFHAIMSSGYSVSLFTNWANKNVNEVWIKSRVEAGRSPTAAPEFYGARLATRNMHPVEDQSAENTTEQLGVPGPWYERLPHFKMGFTPSTGAELQAEYFVASDRAYEAMMAIEQLHDRITPHLFISEIRTIDADQLWMSPCYNRACVAVHTTWKPDWETVRTLLPLVEQQLAPFEPVPHWGKLFTMSPRVLQARYARIGDFRQLLNQYDPGEKFRNEFLDQTISGG
jgi:alditol oxidase